MVLVQKFCFENEERLTNSSMDDGYTLYLILLLRENYPRLHKTRIFYLWAKWLQFFTPPTPTECNLARSAYPEQIRTEIELFLLISRLQKWKKKFS